MSKKKKQNKSKSVKQKSVKNNKKKVVKKTDKKLSGKKNKPASKKAKPAKKSVKQPSKAKTHKKDVKPAKKQLPKANSLKKSKQLSTKLIKPAKQIAAKSANSGNTPTEHNKSKTNQQKQIIKPALPKKPAPAVSTEPEIPKQPLKKIVKTFSSSKPDIVSGKKKIENYPNQFSIEYIIHASATFLFEMISSPSGLSEWFADDVNIRDGNFTFFWDGSSQTAKQIAYKQDKMVRFHWLDKPEHTYFEFRVETDDLTNDTSLIITDFADDGDKSSAKLLWDNQIGILKKAIGS